MADDFCATESDVNEFQEKKSTWGWQMIPVFRIQHTLNAHIYDQDLLFVAYSTIWIYRDSNASKRDPPNE